MKCYHKSTLVKVQTSDGVQKDKPIGELLNDDRLVTYSEVDGLATEPLLTKVAHTEKGMTAQVLSLTYSSPHKTGTLVLTHNHFIFARTGSKADGLQRMMAGKARLGYDLFIPSTGEYAQIVQISEISVPSSDLVAVYTFSNTLIVNDVYGSCQADGDYSEYLDILQKVVGQEVSPSIAQKAGKVIESFLSLRRK